MAAPPVFDLAVTEAVSNVLAQTDQPGLTGSELAAALRHAKLFDLEQGPNKRTRLLSTLHNAQVRRGDGATLVAFINAAMRPASYVTTPGRWEALRAELDEVLVLWGLRINDEGKLATGKKARTLPEAAELAGRLHSELKRRGCHDEILLYCREELIAKSLFHAMSEAAKSIPQRIRGITGLAGDGAVLYDQAFGTKQQPPILRINSLTTVSEESEHKGFKNLLLGIHGHYRNPRVHTTRHGAVESLQDFYDAFSLFSYVHRRLDMATKL
jgi:uncharacterized protein (TIGR02391 family)